MEKTVFASSAPKVGVIGLGGQSAFLSAPRFPTPGETVSCTQLFFELGGKGYNQAIACARMGIATVFIGAVGRDEHAKACRRELLSQGVTPCLIEKDVPTAYAVITTDAGGENTVSVFPGAAKALTAQDLRREQVMAQLKTCTCLLLQNELTTDCLRQACEIGRQLHIPVIFNPAPAHGIPTELLGQCDLLTPNYGEAKLMAGYGPEEQPTGKELVERLTGQGVKDLIITMGGHGAILAQKGSLSEIPAFSCGKPVDTTGAGDTFNGVLCAMLAEGKTMAQAAAVAAIAAGIGVTRPGAAGSIPTRQEVEQYL